ELRSGRTYTARLFDPLLLTSRDVTAHVSAESTLVVSDSADLDSTTMAWVPEHFDTVRAFRIDHDALGKPMRSWIDAQGGLVLAATDSGGDRSFVMERAAFEIVYQNFKKRDTVRIAAQARRIIERERAPAKVAELLTHWVHKSLQRTGPAAGIVPSAVRVLENPRGDCNEAATLFVALARSAGLPARTVAGLIFLN